MFKNVSLINQMRNAILEGITFGSFVASYTGDIKVSELKRLWNNTMNLLNEYEWKQFLEKVAVGCLRDFANALHKIEKIGLSSQEIVDCLDFDEDILEKLLEPCEF